MVATPKIMTTVQQPVSSQSWLLFLLDLNQHTYFSAGNFASGVSWIQSRKEDACRLNSPEASVSPAFVEIAAGAEEPLLLLAEDEEDIDRKVKKGVWLLDTIRLAGKEDESGKGARDDW